MAKKMYDIVPPKAKKPRASTRKAASAVKEISAVKEETPVVTRTRRTSAAPKSAPARKPVAAGIDEPKYFIDDNPKTSVDSAPAAPKLKKASGLKKILIGAGVAAVLVLGFFYFNLQKANVDVLMKTESVSFDNKIVATVAQKDVDLAEKMIPAEYITQEKQQIKEYAATGNTSSEGKAKGTITVYNKYSPTTPITLKAGTHFLSDSGKYFISDTRIVIPAATTKSGKITPGSVDVKVTAVDAGEASNIGAAKFSVPKLSGTAYYYSVYAESDKAMAGGFSTAKKAVTDDDLQNAKSELTESLLEEAQKAVTDKIAANSDYILLDGALTKEIVDASADAKVGAVVEKFNQQASVKVTALVFKKSDLEKLAKEYITSQMDDSRSILDNSLALDYSPDKVDMTDGEMVVNLKFSGKHYFSTSENSLVLLIKNKSADEAKSSIENSLNGQAENVKVGFWPFWTIKTPSNPNKIKVQFQYK